MVDLLYKADKPLTGALLTRIASRCGTYIRTGAVEGLDNKIDVIFDQSLYRQTAHHHDARFQRCRPEVDASSDELGPIE